MFGQGKLRVQQAEVEILQNILASYDIPWLCVLFGLANYYRQIVKDFSVIAKVLTILTGKDQDCI
jgi:hypothetical protein